MIVTNSKAELGLYFDDDKPDLESLAHYGVKGMQWGVRHDKKYTGSRRRGSQKRDISAASRMTKKKLDWATIGAAIGTAGALGSTAFTFAKLVSVGAPLAQAALLTFSAQPMAVIGAAAGTAFLVKRTARLLSYKSKVKKFDAERETEETDKKTGFKKKNKTLSEDEDMKRVNPTFGNLTAESKNNCMLCSTAFDMRRRGYDVRAKGANTGYMASDLKQLYNGIKLSSPQKSLNKSFKEIRDQGEGARGNFMLDWVGSPGGHSMAYSVSNGKVTIYDCQSGEKFNEGVALLKFSSKATNFVYARTDNLSFNTANMKKVLD